MIPLSLIPMLTHTLPRRIAELLDAMAVDARWRIGSETVTTYR